jgi:hypothetical protein
MSEYVIAYKSDLVAIADAIRARTGSTEGLKLPAGFVEAVDGITGESVPDGSAVTFGYENGEPVEREEQYAIASADLNELGAVAQKMAGKRALMTVADMVYWLNRVQFIPQGNAESTFAVNFTSAASGILPDVQKSVATSTLSQLDFVISATC